MSVCKSCGARIVWARTTQGRGIPLDADADSGDAVTYEGGGLVHVGWEGRAPLVESHPGEPGYRTHFASCPNAAAHRKATS